jgi:anti-sigma B factor antagonist
MKAFRLVERDLEPECRQISVIGELDLSVAAELESALDRACAEREKVMIGLEECEFIDSTGIAVIIRAYQRLGESGGRLAVYGPTDQVHRIFTVTGLTNNGLVFGNLDDALGKAA